ncbi:MAG TPA: hypothetical protein PLF59_08250 [Cyclobacteriaceae bacterium]|nr:hypothetical protein [Cyclobacteriaceae bacterium]
MLIDVKFLFTVAQLALEFGEDVIVPIVKACHSDKTDQQKDEATKKIQNLLDNNKDAKTKQQLRANLSPTLTTSGNVVLDSTVCTLC